jgi:hypothetical protein
MQKSPLRGLALVLATFAPAAVGGCNRPAADGASGTDVAALTAARSAVADATVRDGGFAKMNFGTASTLIAKQSTRSYTRWAYLSFDVANLGGAVTSAKVRVFGRLRSNVPGATVRMGVSPLVAQAPWEERAITWATRPKAGAPLASDVITNQDGWHSFDVTGYVKAQAEAGATQVSFVLRNLESSTEYVELASHEAAANQPELAIDFDPPAPPPAPPVAEVPPAPPASPPPVVEPPPPPPVVEVPPAPPVVEVPPAPPVVEPPPAPTPPAATTGTMLAGCPMYPADNEWNRVISADPVDPSSDTYIAYMHATSHLHADFGSDTSYGIPWTTIRGTQPTVPMTFTYADESDPGPYPIPPAAPVEGPPGSTGDRHVLVLDTDNCKLYETFSSYFVGPGWSADSGAIFDLKSNALRPAGFTSADAAGLPILPGLVRKAEIDAGRITHALRFTLVNTQHAYVHPATHYASSLQNPVYPPLGARVRLKASFDTSGYTGAAKIILTAMKEYGMFLADNGGDWYFSGERNAGWNDDDLDQLKRVPGNAFEVIKHGEVFKN